MCEQMGICFVPFLELFFFCLFALSQFDEFIIIITFYYNISYNNIYYYPLEASFFFSVERQRYVWMGGVKVNWGNKKRGIGNHNILFEENIFSRRIKKIVVINLTFTILYFSFTEYDLLPRYFI